MRFAHLSDLHFGSYISRVALHALEDDLRTLNPELLVITGDITDRGRSDQFRLAKDFLESTGIKYIAVPGNREIALSAIWEVILPSLKMCRFSHYFGQKDRITYLAEKERLLFIGVDSVHQFPSWPGKMNRATRYWLKELCGSNRNLTKILCLHHPVVPVPRSSSYWAHTFSDAAEILTIAAEYGISLILQGHKHRSSAMSLFIPEKNASIVIAACGAPIRPEWDRSYNMIEIIDKSLTINRRTLDQDQFIHDGCFEFQLL
jgi:predicted phosphodiesterase